MKRQSRSCRKAQAAAFVGDFVLCWHNRIISYLLPVRRALLGSRFSVRHEPPGRDEARLFHAASIPFVDARISLGRIGWSPREWHAGHGSYPPAIV